MKKKNQAVSIIGGADGPTSVFIVGDKAHLGIIEKIKRNCYQRKRKKTEKGIEADPHSLQEVIAYIISEYGAIEKSKDSHAYQEEYACLKESLILEHKPELLGELAEIKKPDASSEESIQEFLKTLEARSAKAREIPDEMMPMEFHVYQIQIPDIGEMEFSVELNHEFISSGFSGNKKGMKILEKMSQDVYLYYGVTQEDIDNKTKRYTSLVTILSS